MTQLHLNILAFLAIGGLVVAMATVAPAEELIPPLAQHRTDPHAAPELSFPHAPAVELIRADWSALSSGGISRSKENAALSVEVKNLTNQEAFVTLIAHADADGEFVSRLIGQVQVGARQVVAVPIDLRAVCPVALENLQYSAKLDVLTTAVFPNGASATVLSTSMFFHTEGKDFLAYSEELLLAAFGRGDFRRSLPPARQATAQRGLGGSPVEPGRFTIARAVPLSSAALAESENLRRNP